jgi:hypothetical protein
MHFQSSAYYPATASDPLLCGLFKQIPKGVFTLHAYPRRTHKILGIFLAPYGCSRCQPHQAYKLSMFQHLLPNESLEDAPTWQIFSMHCFCVMFVRPHLNPLLDNIIKNTHMPFYQELYKGLAKVGNTILCCILADQQSVLGK